MFTQDFAPGNPQTLGSTYGVSLFRDQHENNDDMFTVTVTDKGNSAFHIVSAATNIIVPAEGKEIDLSLETGFV